MTEQDPPAAPTTPAQQRLPTYPSFPSFPAPGGYDPRRFMPPPSKTKAGWALGLACFPGLVTWIISLILSIQVISDSKQRPGNGKGMAIAALIIMPIWISVIILLVVVDALDDADRDTAGIVTHSGEVSTTDLRLGDCVAENLTEKKYTSIQVTPCDTTHYFEVYATFTLDDGSFPGQDEVDRQAEVGCAKRFARYIDVPLADSKLDVVYLRPFKGSWPVDHGVACLVTTGHQLTESLKFSKR